MHIATDTAIVQIYPHMQPVCCGGIAQAWPVQRHVPCHPQNTEMPPLGRTRLRPGTVKTENGKVKTENGTDAESESRSKIYFDYAEQQGGKDRKAGLKRKTENLEQSG